MMTLQARKLLSPPAAVAFRAYPVDSPRAKARLVVLALLADGKLDGAELAAMLRPGVLQEIGIDRDSFMQVLYDFCADAVHLPHGAGGYQLVPKMLVKLFGEVRATVERETLLRVIVDVIAADGRLSNGEAALLRNVAAAWDVADADALGGLLPATRAAARPTAPASC